MKSEIIYHPSIYQTYKEDKNHLIILQDDNDCETYINCMFGGGAMVMAMYLLL
jgi:hypothetical protein